MGLQPFALSGKFTMSPLLVREVQELTRVPVLTLDALMLPDVESYLRPASPPRILNPKNTNNAIAAREPAA
jgi:hypothetical protein